MTMNHVQFYQLHSIIQVDGNECSPNPIGKALANLEYAGEVQNEHRSTECKL